MANVIVYKVLGLDFQYHAEYVDIEECLLAMSQSEDGLYSVVQKIDGVGRLLKVYSKTVSGHIKRFHSEWMTKEEE